MLPSIRVEDPMLSIVATRRKADKRSGASVPSARQAPLNSSISDIRERIFGVMMRLDIVRSEERRVGKECRLYGIYRWSPDH